MTEKPPIRISSPPHPSSSPPSPTQNDAVSDAASFPTLPTDLIIEFLLRLPVKSLGKSKCVSKQWRSLITDPDFISAHRDICFRNPNVLLVRKTNVPREPHMRKRTKLDLCALNLDGFRENLEFSLYLDEDEKDVEMLPSKCDLVCFVSDGGFYVCNPSTQIMTKLPDPSLCTSGEVDAAMGYVKETNEYIVVHLFDRSLDLHADYDIGCEVLRLTDGGDCSWKEMDMNCPFIVRGWGVFVENIFYWMIWDEYIHSDDEAIVSFDLAKEEFGTVSPPEGCFDPHGAWSLVELGGRLCLVDPMASPVTMDIWVLTDVENQRWVREYSIDMSMYSSDLMNFIVPLDERYGMIVMDVKQESVDYYDVKDKSIKRMDHLIAGEWSWLRLYTESFFSFGNWESKTDGDVCDDED